MTAIYERNDIIWNSFRCCDACKRGYDDIKDGCIVDEKYQHQYFFQSIRAQDEEEDCCVQKDKSHHISI